MFDTRTVRKRLVAVGAGCILLGGAVALPVASVTAGPTSTQANHLVAQNVDWLSSDAASSLNLGFTVLVPSWVPAPFGGAPSISTSGGYYSLYWMNTGGDPTFLQITGQVGGGLPGGSPYDLNNQLFINASVNGYDAIHDVTPIYDQVWWIQDGVLYNVNSRNLADTDSLSLANSLMVLDAGSGGGDTPTTEPGSDNSAAWLSVPESATSGDAVTVSVGDATNVNVTVDGGAFSETGDYGIYGVSGGSFTWNAPSVDTATTYTFYLTDASTGGSLGSAAIVVNPHVATQPTAVPATEVPPTAVPVTEVPPTDVPATEAPVESETQAAAPETVVAASDGSDGAAVLPTETAPAPTTAPVVNTSAQGDGTGVTPTGTPVSSDGTDGPARPVIGGDGTGGIQSVEVPSTPGSPYEP